VKDYKELCDFSDKGSIAIFGAGPSLYDFVISNYYNNLIFNYPVISVNSSIMITPWRTGSTKNRYWISNDSLCRRWSWWKRVLDSHCHKIVRDSWKKYESELKNFYVFSPRPTSEGEINPGDKGLCYTSSIPSAIDFALQIGYKKIFLFGVDQCLDEEKKYHHFWQFFPKEKQPKQIKPAQGSWDSQKKVFEYNNLAYKALSKFAGYKQAEIYNVSYMSKDDNKQWVTEVDAFEIIHINKIEKIIDK
jgi:hypothetical protein